MKRNIKKSISLLVALAMTLTSASIVFADGELVTSVQYKNGILTVTGTTDKANEAVDVFLLNPGETKADLDAADTTAEYKDTVNFSDVIYSDAAKAYEITFGINGLDDNASYLLYVKSESGEEYERKISSNNIYVALNGSDANGDGSKEKPFATIQKAQAEARKAIKGFATNVIIGEGEYSITSQLEFTEEDSGTADAPVTYKAEEGAKVVFTGSKKISMDKISPLTDADSAIIARLPEAVANKVVKVDLSEIDDTVTGYASNFKPGGRIKPMGVYLNDDYQEISRWPNIGYTNIAANDIIGATSKESSQDYAKVVIKDLDYEKVSNWDLDNVFIDGYLRYEWYVDSAKIASVTDGSLNDPETAAGGAATVDGAVIQLASATAYGVADGGRVILKNILEEIDSPGEWYVDGKTMYYYPPHTLTDKDTLEITNLTQNFVTINGASNFAIEGITFEKNSNAGSGNGIAITKGDNITIKKCTMKDLGAWGITHSGATKVTIDGCVMNNLGLGGIESTSGDKSTLTTAETVIQNCHISDIARDYQANTIAGVTIDGDGAVVKNNTFHNMKNSAIRYSGTNHLFKHNEIFNAVNDTTDAGAIYSGRSHIEYGSKILNNYLYQIGGRSELTAELPVAGIYWDDIDSGETAIGNIIVTSSEAEGTMGIYIGGGADITATDNIIVNASTAKPTKGSTGPYAIKADERGSRSHIEDGSFRTNETFFTFQYALQTVPTIDQTEIGDLKYDVDGDGTVSSDEIFGARILKAEESNWKSAYLNAFDSKVKTMFDAIKAKTYIRRNTYKNNFSYEAYDMLESNMKPANAVGQLFGQGDSTTTYTESKELSKSDFEDPENNDYRLKNAQGTEAITTSTELTTFGAQGYEIADEEKEFDLVFPANKATVLNTSTYIKWEKVNVADEYIVKYSKDANLSNATEITTTETMVELTDLEDNTTYYWSVEAVNNSFNIGGSLGTKTSEFTIATYEFSNPIYNATDATITVDYVNQGAAAIENVSFIAAVKVGGKLMSSAVDVQNVAITDGDTITIPASTLTNIEDGAVLELYIWDKDMNSLTGKMLLDI